MITKDQLTKWRHRLVHSQELYTQAYQETQEVIHEILKEEELYGTNNSSNINSNIYTRSNDLQSINNNFKPITKVKGDPLAELLHSIPQEQRASLIEKLQDKTKENT